MAEPGTELQRIVWSQAFPFVRLFRTLPLALNLNRLVLGLLCVLCVYVGGRVLDRLWISAGGGVNVMAIEENSINEIEVYVGGGSAAFERWVSRAADDDADAHSYLKKGPFISIALFEARCFASAVHGVCTGNLGFGAGNQGDPPGMATSIGLAFRGIYWLVTQRPWFAIVFGLFHLIVFALFGGAICRSAAVESARDENISLGEALQFAREKYTALLLAPLVPLIVFAIIALVMVVGGLVAGLLGKIPIIGGLVVGLPYVLALLGGLALAVIVLALAFGYHLMWPTIAVEGSDQFDGLSRATYFAGMRIWNVLFYTAVLLGYGALSYVLVRAVVLFLLKMTNVFIGAGMNVWGASSGEGVGLHAALWSMPSWADLAILPNPQGPSLFGSFFNGELSMTENLAAFFIAVWVFLLMGALVGFVISYFFCGSTQMYFLLRRDIDATDYDEIFYEEPEEMLPSAAPAAGSSSGGETPAPETGAAPDSDETTPG